MKKVRILQILVYIVFGLFIFQNQDADIWPGFKDGYNNGTGATDDTKRYRPTLQTAIAKSFVSQIKGGN